MISFHENSVIFGGALARCLLDEHLVDQRVKRVKIRVHSDLELRHDEPLFSDLLFGRPGANRSGLWGSALSVAERSFLSTAE